MTADLAPIDACRACGSTRLETFLALGSLPPSDAFIAPEALARSEARYPLDVAFCPDCTLVQILHTVPPEELFAGIRATARGETVLAPSVAATLVRRATPGAITITEREVEVLELLSRGLGNKELARELFVSEATVKSHLSHIYVKLGVDTRAGAVAAAIERPIIRH